MHSKKKQEIIQHLLAVAGKAEAPSFHKVQPKRFQGENGAFGLSEEAFGNYRRILELILSEQDWSAKFSELYIDRAITDLLVKAMKPGKVSLEPILDQLLLDLSTFSDNVVVYIPISGLTMDIELLEIGNIILRKATKEFLEQIFTRIASLTYPEEQPNPSQ